MSEKQQAFLKSIEQSSKKKDKQKIFSEKTSQYFSSLEERKKHFSDFETAKRRATFTRWKTIENLDKYLIEFEANLIKRGGKIVWAQDAREVADEILKIVKQREAAFVSNKNSSVFKETNLIKAFPDSTEVEKKQACIIEADFIIADSGAICILNASPVFSSSQIKIVVAGMDRLLPTLTDLDLFLSLQTWFTNNFSQADTHQILFGPVVNEDGNFSEELYVILLDNNRSKIMSDAIARQTLWCTGCGACNYTDSIYRLSGEEFYSSGLTGSIGAAKLPFMEDFKEYYHLAEAQPLDGLSSEICPVNIDFTKIFLHARKLAVEKQLTSSSEKWFYFFWKKTMLKRNLIKLKGIKTLSYFVNKIFNSSEKGLFATRQSAHKSFNEQWREKIKG